MVIEGDVYPNETLIFSSIDSFDPDGEPTNPQYTWTLPDGTTTAVAAAVGTLVAVVAMVAVVKSSYSYNHRLQYNRNSGIGYATVTFENNFDCS